MSTTDLRGDRNITASRAGTSTPSDRQRALVRMRQVSSAGSSCSQSSWRLRSSALKVPSTCCDAAAAAASSPSVLEAGAARRSSSVTSVEQLLDPLGVLDVAGERDGAAHRRGVGLEGVLGLAALGQPVPAADDLGGVVELELVVVVGELLLEGAGHRLLVDGEHEHLVVGEQVALDGLAEAEPVELRAVELLVVHRGEDRVRLAGLGLARRRRRCAAWRSCRAAWRPAGRRCRARGRTPTRRRRRAWRRSCGAPRRQTIRSNGGRPCCAWATTSIDW